MKPKLSLSETERIEAQRFVRQGKANARTLTRAWVLLKLADGWDETKVAETFAISPATVKNVAHRFAEDGLDLVLHDRVQQRRRQALTGKPPAHLIAITCSPAPDGHDRLPRALARAKSGRAGVCEEHFAQHHSRTAQKNELKRGPHEHWCLPSVGGEFVAAMEDVLDLYEEEYDPQYPTVCLDEKPVVLHAAVHPSVPVKPGHPERVDYEYERKGVRNLFVMVEPLAGWRHVEVTAQRTMQDYAKVVRWLVDEVYPQAEYIRLVQDNLNTHMPAALYETFPPA